LTNIVENGKLLLFIFMIQIVEAKNANINLKNF